MGEGCKTGAKGEEIGKLNKSGIKLMREVRNLPVNEMGVGASRL